MVKQVGILGAGQMGGGIAHVCALAGIKVALYDSAAGATTAALGVIEKNLARQQAKNTISPKQAQDALAHITPFSNIRPWPAACDFVIEAVVEDITVKHALYREIEPQLRDDAILASNTSSYSIGKLASVCALPSRFIGMHFMNPVPLMPLVEIIAGAKTADAVLHRTENLAATLGKQTVRATDQPGFITNRVLLPLINEAVWALHTKIGNVEDIDRAMILGMNHPMGPLTLADFVGLDTCLAILDVLREGFGDKFEACPLLRQMVAAGYLGRKSGRGFYDYSGDTPKPAV